MAKGFSWSISRHDCFQTCRRRYYYSYYAALEDPEVRRLKRLSALPLWAGSVVHETIESVLKAHDRPLSPPEQEALVHTVVHDRMLGEWRQSEAGPDGFRLFEHEYEVPVGQEDKQILVGTVRRSLRAFFGSDTLAEALGVGRSRWLTVEDLVSFHVDDVEVLLRMDLAYRGPDGRLVIVDWKTGRAAGRFNEVQLAGYALAALEKGWVASPEEICTELAYLALPRFVRREVDRQRVEEARAFVRKSAESMRALLADPVANLARIDDFTRVDRPPVCRRCSFRRLCFPRGVEVEEGPPVTA